MYFVLNAENAVERSPFGEIRILSFNPLFTGGGGYWTPGHFFVNISALNVVEIL